MKHIRLIIVGILLGTFLGLSCVAEESKAPVGHWTFNEGSGATVADLSGNENRGTMANSMRAVAWSAGRNGKALRFSGSQTNRNANGCVVIPNLTNKYDFDQGITIEAWIQLAAGMTRAGNYELVSNTESDRGKGFRLRVAWSRLMFGSGEGGGDGKVWQAASAPARTSIKPETWYHVAGTYDGSVFRVYLDGEEVGVSDPNLALTRGQKDVFIGAYCGGYAYGFEGLIDEVKIYDRALAPAEILTHAKLVP
ncbi:MAG: LamG domain-containing protein [Verrucomicrobia bacterium]|nr:LamG domain-containing protein [Verrucomicrobiota bacterium]